MVKTNVSTKYNLKQKWPLFRAILLLIYFSINNIKLYSVRRVRIGTYCYRSAGCLGRWKVIDGGFIGGIHRGNESAIVDCIAIHQVLYIAGNRKVITLVSRIIKAAKGAQPS